MCVHVWVWVVCMYVYVCVCMCVCVGGVCSMWWVCVVCGVTLMVKQLYSHT